MMVNFISEEKAQLALWVASQCDQASVFSSLLIFAH
jgi:hypothetical protein